MTQPLYVENKHVSAPMADSSWRVNDIRLSPSDSVIFHELLKSLNTWYLCRWDSNSFMLLVALIQLQLESMLICYCWWLLRAAKSFEASNNERCSSYGDPERCVFVLPHEWGSYEKFQNERVHNELTLTESVLFVLKQFLLWCCIFDRWCPDR